MSQNQTLTDCLAKTGQDQHLKLRTQSHILSLKVFFFDKKNSKPLRQIFSMAETL